MAEDQGNPPNSRAGLRGVVADPQQSALRPGDGFEVVTLSRFMTAPQLGPGPLEVKNWDFFEGAVMGVGLQHQDGFCESVGTAILIAPGLAVTATHVLSDHLIEVQKRTVVPFCTGPRPGGLDIWNVRSWSFGSGRCDISYLSLDLASARSQDWRCHTVPLTTRSPRVDESLVIVGLRLSAEPGSDVDVVFRGDLFTSAGRVSAVYPHGRDNIMVNYAAIEIACGSLGGMSGGAVFDETGHLVGIISAGMDTDGVPDLTYGAWIIGALNREVSLSWPPGLHPRPVHLMEIDPRLLKIEGRDRWVRVDENRFTYRVWFDRE